MNLKHELLVVEESLLLGVDIQMLKKLLGHEWFATAWIAPQIYGFDVIQLFVVLLDPLERPPLGINSGEPFAFDLLEIIFISFDLMQINE